MDFPQLKVFPRRPYLHQFVIVRRLVLPKTTNTSLREIQNLLVATSFWNSGYQRFMETSLRRTLYWKIWGLSPDHIWMMRQSVCVCWEPLWLTSYWVFHTSFFSEEKTWLKPFWEFLRPPTCSIGLCLCFCGQWSRRWLFCSKVKKKEKLKLK